MPTSMSDASSCTSETSEAGQSSAISDTVIDATPEEIFRQRDQARRNAAHDEYTTLRTAVDNDSAAVRDFAFSPDDERYRGVGSVIPRQNAEHVALYDFVAESENELSITAGQQVHVLRESDAGWVVAQVESASGVHRGLVPEAYLGTP